MVGKFRVKTDGQKVLVEQNRMRFEQITSRERTRAPDGIDDLVPEPLQLAIATGTHVCGGQRGGRARGFEAGRFGRGSGATGRANRRRSVRRRGRRVRGHGDGNNFAGIVVPARFLKPFEHGVDARRVARFDGFKQRDFNQNFLRHGVAQTSFAIGQDLHDARQSLGTDAAGLFAQRRGLGF